MAGQHRMAHSLRETAAIYLTHDEQDTLNRFLLQLDQMCGAHIARVILFGSRARGDHTAESDIDLLVVGSDGVDDITGVIQRLQAESGALSVLVMAQADYRRRQRLLEPLYVNIRRDGIELWDPKAASMEEQDVPLRFPEGHRRTMDAATREVIEQYMKVASRQLGEADTLLKAGFGEGAVSRSYFAIFHAATAALYAVNVVRGKHSGGQAAISQFLVQPGRLERSYADTYNRLFKLRQTGDYEPTYVVSIEEASALVADAVAFVARIRQFLDEQGDADGPQTENDT